MEIILSFNYAISTVSLSTAQFISAAVAINNDNYYILCIPIEFTTSAGLFLCTVYSDVLASPPPPQSL